MFKVLILGSGIQAAMAAIALARSSGDKSIHWAQSSTSARCEFQCAGPDFESFLALLSPEVQAQAAQTCLERLTGYHFKRTFAEPVDHIHTWSDYGAPFRVFPFASVYHALDPKAQNGIDHYSVAARSAREGVEPVLSGDPSSIFSTVQLGFRVKTAPFFDILCNYADTLGVEFVDAPDFAGDSLSGGTEKFSGLLETYDRVVDCRDRESRPVGDGPDVCRYRIDYRSDPCGHSQLREIVSLEGGVVVLDRSALGCAASVYTRDPGQGEQLLASALHQTGDNVNGFYLVNTREVSCVLSDVQSTSRVLDLCSDDGWPEIGASQLDYQWAAVRSVLDVIFLAPNAELARIHDQRLARYTRDYGLVLTIVDRLFARELSVCVSSGVSQSVADELEAFDRSGTWHYDAPSPIFANLDCLLAGLGRIPDHLNVKCSFYQQKEFVEFSQLIDSAIRKALSKLKSD